MPVDPQVQVLLDVMAAAPGPKLHELSPGDARAVYDAIAAGRTPLDEVAATEDLTVPTPDGPLPVRLYRPEDATGAVVVFFHGGGWVIGNVGSHDSLCRSLAARAGAVVVSVDYRLAPETPYPGPLDDCVAAVRWVADHAGELGVDPGRLAVAGDSAGGNLAAAVAIRARDEGEPAIAFQLLVYPVTDHSFSQASYTENADGYFLTADAMRWFSAHYLGDAPPDDPLAAPLHAPDLAGLPPALVITAEYDPLRDEGEAYAARLQEAGVPARASRYDGMIHGFVSLAALVDRGAEGLDECARALRDALAPAAPTTLEQSAK